MTENENPHAGQGSVLLDIGGDVGALVVTMPPAMVGVEIEIARRGRRRAPRRAARARARHDTVTGTTTGTGTARTSRSWTDP